MKPGKNKRESNSQGLRKRLRLLKAAGKVFAKQGYAGTSVRDIAGAARTHSSALIYHFGSKKRLFLETLQHHIIDNAGLDRLFDAFLDADPQKPQTLSDALHTSVRNILRATHGPAGRVQNLDGLLVRMLTETDLKVNRVIQEMGDRVMAGVFEKLLAWNPGLTRTDIYWWSHMFWALYFYPITGRLLLLSESGERSYSKDFLDSLAWRFTQQCCLSLGLPLPAGGDSWTLKG
jgi:AcrR family transcriptional regulator